MKFFALLLTFFAFASAEAQTQITITSSDMPVSGDTIRYSNADPTTNIDLSQTGPNFTWDFSSLTSINQGVYEYKSASSTPYAFFFFGNFGLKVSDSLGVANFTLEDIYQFYDTQTGSFEATGSGIRFQGLPIPANYSDPDEIYTFPLEYGDIDSSTFKVSFQLGTFIQYQQEGDRVNEVDGWGEITTPFGTFDCIRVRSRIEELDSVLISGVGTQFPVTRVEYRWLANGIHIPILEVLGTELLGNFTPTQIRYRDNVPPVIDPIGISDVETARQISVFPNPASQHINIIGENIQGKEFELVDIAGRKMTSFSPNRQVYQIDISFLSPGIYYLRSSDSDLGLVHPIVIR